MPGAANDLIWKSSGSFWRAVTLDLDPSRPAAADVATMIESLARSTPCGAIQNLAKPLSQTSSMNKKRKPDGDLKIDYARNLWRVGLSRE